jgi:hypothetical protein
MPDKLSLAANVMVAWSPTTLALVVGAVRSICTITMLLGVLVLPARSLTLCAVELMPTPEGASPQPKVTVTGALYQPFAMGLVVAAALSVGAVASRLIVTLWLAVPPTLVAEQRKKMPAVSVLTL